MIRMKIAFALRLVDDFSGHCIRKKKFTFVISGRVVHPIEKEEGLYVFLEPQEKETRVWIDGPDYHSCSVEIQKELLNPEEPIADIRLYGKAGKDFPYTCGVYSGQLEREKIRLPAEIYVKKSKPTGLVLKEYRESAGHWLFFQGFTRENLIGKPYVLGSGKEAVPFIIAEKQGINEYRVELLENLPNHLKAGTPLERIYRSVTDEKGSYSIPVECGEEECIRDVMLLHHSPSARERGG